MRMLRVADFHPKGRVFTAERPWCSRAVLVFNDVGFAGVLGASVSAIVTPVIVATFLHDHSYSL